MTISSSQAKKYIYKNVHFAAALFFNMIFLVLAYIECFRRSVQKSIQVNWLV